MVSDYDGRATGTTLLSGQELTGVLDLLASSGLIRILQVDSFLHLDTYSS